MMVSITNGLQTVVVSAGAYREIYLPQGWQLTKAEEPKESQNLPEPPDQPGGVVSPPEAPESDQADSSESTEDDDDQEEEAGQDLPDEDILFRPLGELSLDELKKVAELRKVDIEGLRTKKEVRTAIRNAQ